MALEPNAGDAAEEKVNILLVDDRPDKLLAHEVILADLNQNLVRATSGTEALSSPSQAGLRGHSSRREHARDGRLRDGRADSPTPRSETTPIIFISAVNDTQTHVSRGYSLGAVDYDLLTPVVPENPASKNRWLCRSAQENRAGKKQAEERASYSEQAARAEVPSAPAGTARFPC